MSENVPSPRFNITLGIISIILGILSFIVTYRYVVPTGSIILTVCGIFLILMRNYGRDGDIYEI